MGSSSLKHGMVRGGKDAKAAAKLAAANGAAAAASEEQHARAGRPLRLLARAVLDEIDVGKSA